MFFKNIVFYQIPKNSLSADTLAAALANHPFFPCGATEPQRVGWSQPTADNGGTMAHVVNQQILIALCSEQKILPSSVVKRMADERAKLIEQNEGRKVGRKELRDLREAIAVELLPNALTKRQITYAWIDPINGWLVVNASSPGKAEELVEQLGRAMDGNLPIGRLRTEKSPGSAMTGWMAANEAPAGFTIDQDGELRSAENATVRYTRHSLDGKDIREHIAQGKVVTRLGMTWNERISFVFTETAQLKRVTFLDIITEQSEGQAENEAERFDLDFTLMTGELARLLADLTGELGLIDALTS